jgi:hypothetical protein
MDQKARSSVLFRPFMLVVVAVVAVVAVAWPRQIEVRCHLSAGRSAE